MCFLNRLPNGPLIIRQAVLPAHSEASLTEGAIFLTFKKIGATAS
jgi:hypothetical protein